MNEDLDNIQYSQVRNYRYSEFFKTIEPNGKTLSEDEKRDLVQVIDETIAQYSEGLPLTHNELERIKGKEDAYSVLDRAVNSIELFLLTTMIDSMVLGKYFILAEKDIDRRILRGKLCVVLNEGFKKLYGFDEKTFKRSEWAKLLPLMKYFPEVINRQYQEMTALLKKASKSSSWWKEERNLETHLDAEKLYESRQEEIVEGKVMLDSMKLFDTLLAVSHFLTNANACLLNFLITKYRQGELAEE